MFTGIVEGIGKIKRKMQGMSGDVVISIEPPFSTKECEIGESISVDGVCLTVTTIDNKEIFMDISQETISRSTLGMLTVGDLVNIERALRLSDRIGGHLVLGHVDGMGKIISKEQREGSYLLRIAVNKDISRYIVEKGSVAVDGMSLTVNRCGEDFFELNIIPHTFSQTTILKKRIDFVNIETDIVGKYVEKFLNSIKLKDSKVTIEKLKKYGFIR
ncbi:MAG: riboflavin synthase [Deltaproteobacteria bacterium]|nr:MAG: riboflavin synthase [Deltaproteobacteria bacterium]